MQEEKNRYWIGSQQFLLQEHTTSFVVVSCENRMKSILAMLSELGNFKLCDYFWATQVLRVLLFSELE